MDNVSVYKIINDAMKKGDRTVNILIHNGMVSVNVYPYTEEKHHWIRSPCHRDAYCSNCGHSDASWECSTFCPGCGEQMYGVKDE